MHKFELKEHIENERIKESKTKKYGNQYIWQVSEMLFEKK